MVALTTQTRFYISPDTTAAARPAFNADDGFVDLANMHDDNDATEGGGVVSSGPIAIRANEFRLDGGHPDLPTGGPTLWAGLVVNWESDGAAGEARFRVQVENIDFSVFANKIFTPRSTRGTDAVLFAPPDRYQTSDAVRGVLSWEWLAGAGHDLRCYEVWFIATPGTHATTMGG